MKGILETINESIKHGYTKQQEKRKASGKEIVVATSREHLIQLIGEEIKDSGPECDLNFIDVSQVRDMSYVFYNYALFDGDISGWDTSSVENMNCMFMMSQFTGKNGDISDWDVRKVVTADRMFYKSKYDGDLSRWDLASLSPKNARQFIGGAAIAKSRKKWPKLFR